MQTPQDKIREHFHAAMSRHDGVPFQNYWRLRATCITDRDYSLQGFIQHRSTPRCLFQYMKYSDSKNSKPMPSRSFSNQSDSFSSDLHGFKKSITHTHKNNNIEVKCTKYKCLFVSSN